MTSPLDEFFALLPEAIEGYVDQYRAIKRIHVRAADGRTVTVYFRPEIIKEALADPADISWLGQPGWSPLRRWIALMSVHLDESINGLGKASEYVQRAGGFDPVEGSRLPDDESDLTGIDPARTYAIMGDRVLDADGERHIRPGDQGA